MRPASTSRATHRIGDLGYQLPPYSEEVVRLDMDDGQYLDYVSLYNDLYEQVTAWQKGRASWVSAWASWSLNRPNSCFRAEKVMIKEPYPSKEYFLWRTLPPIVPADAVDPDKPWFPKDVWLRQFCMAEKRQGRKTLVFFRQTDTRDIQPHVKAALEDAGLRVKILPKTIEADKREAWIRKHVDDIDVLITHPKKVETGLDLVEFQNAVFYEIEYSLYTLQQAMRRIWRLGQTQPVKIIYLVYRDCFESAAFALMKEKMKAASLLYGDDAASAMEDETDDAGKSVQGDGFLTELASRILAGEQFDDGGITGLLDLTASGEAWAEPAFAESEADARVDAPVDESAHESDAAGADEDSVFEMEMPTRPATSGVAWWALRQSMLQGGQLPSRRKSPPRSRKERVQPDIFAEVDDGPMVVQGMLF